MWGVVFSVSKLIDKFLHKIRREEGNTKNKILLHNDSRNDFVF